MRLAKRTAGVGRIPLIRPPGSRPLRDQLRDPLVRDVLALAAAIVAVGASFGAIAAAAALPLWWITAMSVLVFAGGAQFMAVGLVAAGNPIAAVLAGLLLNARHLPFGLAVADAVGGSWPARLAGSHLMTDEAVAFTLAQPDPASRRRAYLLTGTTLFVAWNVGSLLGVALGEAAGDPATLGVDAAFPAGLLALLLPSLRDRETRTVAALGAAVAVLTTPLLPPGLPVLLALTGLLVLAAPRARTAEEGASTTEEGVRPADERAPAAEVGAHATGEEGRC